MTAVEQRASAEVKICEALGLPPASVRRIEIDMRPLKTEVIVTLTPCTKEQLQVIADEIPNLAPHVRLVPFEMEGNK